MTIDSNQLKGILAIVAGIMTIFKMEAWIGPGWPPSFVVRGPGSILVGVLAILLGVFLLLAPA